jgi:hypothetical protein
MSATQPQLGRAAGDVCRAASGFTEQAGPIARLASAWFFLAARLTFGAFLVVTSAYCLLMYIPFAYFGFIHNPLLAWLPVFAKIHGYLYLALLVSVAVTLVPAFRAPETKKSAATFVVLNCAIGVGLVWRSALATMGRDLAPYIWSMLALFPLLWLAALDLAPGVSAAPQSCAHWRPNLTTTAFAGLGVALVFAISSSLHRAVPGVPGFSFLGFSASLVFHVILFALFGLAIQLIAALARAASRPEQAYFVLWCVLDWLIYTLVLRNIVLPTISFEGWQATVFAATVSMAIVTYRAGVMRRFRSERMGEKPGNTQPAGNSSVWLRIGAVVALAAAAYAVPELIGRIDWDFVLRKMAVLTLWGAALGCCQWCAAWLQKRTARAALVSLLVSAMLGFGGYEYEGFAHWHASGKSGHDREWNYLSSALDSYSGSDISFKTAYDILSRAVDNEGHQDFYNFLSQNTNLDRNVAVAPVDVKLVSDLKRTPGRKPNIFLFVIDSLRKDYISPYNPSVSYTPQIAEFARNSVVMQNAFTRYAGTALSEPAIWVGALQLHKQYIEPFYPMNSLQKLLDTDGYHSYVSVDPILKMALKPSADIVELDKNNQIWNDLDFVLTLKELQSKIAARPDKTRPIFAYTQPQNVHTVTLARQQLGGRAEMSAYELKRMDGAFGSFIKFLKDCGLYDNSIIILTSDHGDSYGEFGRYGHADFLFPEVVRIPLIIHLPPYMRDELVWDTRLLSSSLDITPSLYYLLGHRPIVKNDLFGRPLFTETRAELDSYLHPHYLLGSSYAAFYGVLSDNGKSLFMVDAVHHRSYFYDLEADPSGIHNHATSQLLDENEPIIRKEIGLISDFYHYHPAQN